MDTRSRQTRSLLIGVLLCTILLAMVFVIVRGGHDHDGDGVGDVGGGETIKRGDALTRQSRSRGLMGIEGSNASSCTTLDAVILTTGKDSLAFERSIRSCLDHFLDVRNFYVVTPNVDELTKKFMHLGNRVKFVGEEGFPFRPVNVSEVMYETVKQVGIYPLDGGKSPFEGTIYGRVGWFLQQLLKFYAGQVIGLEDFILLDSDVVWLRDIRFVASCNATHRSYYYASSRQYHPAYMATIGRISGVGPVSSKVHRSGIVHHMVIVKKVLKSMMADAERLHGGLPFWQVLLNVSAREMTCHAPRTGICGAGSTLSEYELYFNYARTKFPETVTLRSLLWTNGPMPGLLFWPNPQDGLGSDGYKARYRPHRVWQHADILDKNIISDRAQGYDYVGYHAYAKRRYSEMVEPDLQELCQNITAPVNTTCSWRQYEELEEQWRKAAINVTEAARNSSRGVTVWTPPTVPAYRNVSDYFKGCACWMANNQRGP